MLSLAQSSRRQVTMWLVRLVPNTFYFSSSVSWFGSFSVPLLTLASPLFTSLFRYSLSYSISLLFLRLRCCDCWFLWQTTLHLVRNLSTSAASAFQAALGCQHLINVALAFVTGLNMHKVKQGLNRIRADESDIKLVTFTTDSIL